jgi:CubicO group peptidase (beta-lactamase class C family)
MHLRLFFAIISLVVGSPIFSQGLPVDSRLKHIDTVVTKIMKGFNTDGCEIVVVEKNKIIYSGNFGYFDHKQKIPVEANTVFPIASCTKPFTAAMIGILAAEKKLDIDSPVYEYYPNLAFYTKELTMNVTARDMMSHRTGLPRHDMMFTNAHTLPLDTIAYRIRFLEPFAPLRYKAEYNNLMFVCLGAIVQKLAGKPFEQSMAERIFSPLEMTHTTLLPSNISPCGGIISTATDLGNFLITWIYGGKFKNKQVFPESFAKEAMTDQMSLHDFPSKDFPDSYLGSYGLDWELVSYHGHYMVSHGGDLPDFSSKVTFFPTDSIGIIVLANSFNTGWTPNAITYAFADRLLRLPIGDYYTPAKQWYDDYNKQNQDTDNGTRHLSSPLTHPLGDYAGKYFHPGYGMMEIKRSGDSLVCFLNDVPLAIRHYSYDAYISSDIRGGSLRFATGIDGKINSIVSPFEENIAEIVFLKQLN